MGADIYLNSVFENNNKKYSEKFNKAVQKRDAAVGELAKKEAQEEVTKYYDLMYAKGYFRDSYNATSLFWTIGMSWWTDVGEFTDEEANLPVEKCKEILARLKASKIPSAKDLEKHLAEHHACLDEGENSPESWRKFFVKKRQNLIKLMEKAIELNEPLYCSV